MYRLKQSLKHKFSLKRRRNIKLLEGAVTRTADHSTRDCRQGERLAKPVIQPLGLTESAATASSMANSKNSGDWPMNSPSSVNAFTVATAPPRSVSVGRITEQRGRLLLMKLHGSGRILLVCVSSVAGLFRSGKLWPVMGSTTPANGCDTAFPPLSCQRPK